MKKNLLTIFILALCVINLVLSAVIIFSVVPTTIRTNKFIAKVASNLDLELGEKTAETKEKISVADLETYPLKEDITVNLKNDENDSNNHYALVKVSLSINKKSKDYETLNPTVETNENSIREIVFDEFSQYTVNTVLDNKDKIKSNILKNIQEYFNSDFIPAISVSFVTE